MDTTSKMIPFAESISKLYSRLAQEQFLGDVSIDFDQETLSIWEGTLEITYTGTELAEFSEEGIGHVLAAYRQHQQAFPRTLPEAPAAISYAEAEQIARQKLPAHPFLAYHITPVDLATQKDFFTEDEPDDYESIAWKVWYISISGHSTDNLPRTELFYISLPIVKPYVIR